MKTLFIGGIKSGKSKDAEKYTIKHAIKKPYYLATTELLDKEMKQRIKKHKKQRQNSFITIEEGLKLNKAVSTCQDIVLIECMGMWINNMLFHKFEYKKIKKEVVKLLKQKQDMVFVVNDVGSGIISDNYLSREFADINGKISQLIAKNCDEVFYTIAGISVKIK